MSKFRDYDQQQGVMKVIIPDELLETNHPARLIDKVVESLDLKQIYSDYEEEGNEAYHPKMMLKVLFYAYYIGVMSGRGIWEELKVRADFIFLSGDQVPDFRTINRFRVRHIEALSGLFTQIVMICVKLGMVGFEHLAVDGEKIQANASLQKSMNLEGLQKAYGRAKDGIRKLLEQDVDEHFTVEKRGKRIDVLDRRIRQLDKFRKELEDIEADKRLNITDPESKVMTHKDGHKDASYNHQSAIDGKYGVTTAVITKGHEDKPEDLYKLVDKSKENTQQSHKVVAADSGFNSLEVMKIAAEDREENILVPDRRYSVDEKGESGKRSFDPGHFKIGETTAECPMGQEMDLVSVKRYNEGHTTRIYAGKFCGACVVRGKCTSGKTRTIAVDSRNKYKELMRDKLRSVAGRELYMKRQGIIENAHGNDQKNKGWIQHHLRSKRKASLEFMLIRMVSNLAKIIRFRAEEFMFMVT
jgi:transposase